jgi:hypothetical protein
MMEGKSKGQICTEKAIADVNSSEGTKCVREKRAKQSDDAKEKAALTWLLSLLHVRTKLHRKPFTGDISRGVGVIVFAKVFLIV